MKGRIYVSREGINAQLSIHVSESLALFKWLRSHEVFRTIDFNIHTDDEHAFAKMTIKLRKNLVAHDLNLDFKKKGTYLTPEEWRKALDSPEEHVVLVDVRNGYEWDVGHFEGAERPDYETFRDFPKYIEKLKMKYDHKKTKFLMFCTGGIRCEFFSPMMIEAGLENIYQLKGGVIKYGLEEGSKHWKGGLFVFDDRLVVKISDEIISYCHLCDEKSSTYYNCANMDCNKLFLSCPKCVEKMQGCCCKPCSTVPMRREFKKIARPKPYRKLSFEEKQRLRHSNEMNTSNVRIVSQEI